MCILLVIILGEAISIVFLLLLTQSHTEHNLCNNKGRKGEHPVNINSLKTSVSGKASPPTTIWKRISKCMNIRSLQRLKIPGWIELFTSAGKCASSVILNVYTHHFCDIQSHKMHTTFAEDRLNISSHLVLLSVFCLLSVCTSQSGIIWKLLYWFKHGGYLSCFSVFALLYGLQKNTYSTQGKKLLAKNEK